jgi:hypothetical protein
MWLGTEVTCCKTQDWIEPDQTTPAFSYGKLYDKLRALGFAQRSIELSGKPRYVFEHKTIPNAMIILPERDRDEPVEPFHMRSVLATLKAHGLVVESNPLLT